jgi:hypothetical protein
MPGTEEVLLSAAAYYLLGSCKKTDLPALLGEIDVHCFLMLHENIDKFLADPGATRVDFVRSDQDGCWLWYDQGGGKSLGIPIDVNIFRIPPAPALLARLCEGITPSVELRITGVVRPCSFQRDMNANTWQLIGRGLIQTFGGSQVGTYSQPRAFSTLRSLLKPVLSSSGPSSLAAVVKAQLELARDRILVLERGNQESKSLLDRLGRVQSDLSALGSRVSTMAEAAAQQTWQAPQPQPNPNAMAMQINNLAKAIKEKAGKIQALEAKLEALCVQLNRLTDVWEKEPQQSIGAIVARTETLLTQGTQFEKSPKALQTDPVQRTYTEPAAPAGSPEPSPGLNSIAMGSPSVRPPLPLPQGATDMNALSHQSDPEPQLPDGWQRVLAAAPEKADPDPSVHVAALLGLVTRLKRLAGSHAIHLVHVVESQRRIQVHFAEADRQQIRCQCGVSKPFSFAVCAGEKGSRRLPLLFPSGSYSGSNYPAGYSVLISGFRGDSFTIQRVDAPAILQQVPGSAFDEYTVAQQMQITQPR